MGPAKHQRGEGTRLGLAEAASKPSFVWSAPEFLLSHVEARLWGWTGASPIPSVLPALALIEWALREHTPGEDMQEAEGNFKCHRQCNGSCGVPRPVTLSPGPVGPGEAVVASTVSGAN